MMPTNALDNNVILNEQSFCRTMSLERKRTERSRKPFLLVLLDMGDGRGSLPSKVPPNIVSVLSSVTRETDVMGWYRQEQALGVMFTEIDPSNKHVVLNVMAGRIGNALRSALPPEQFNRINLSFHLFPEDLEVDKKIQPTNRTLYPDLVKRDDARKGLRILKRTIDIVASCLALAVGSPVFLLIAVLIKLTSRGPVFFRQERIGQYAVPFMFLKFRSMCEGTDAEVHKTYVRKLIAGEIDAHSGNGGGPAVYKLAADDRVTPIGKFLRRTSLDELPQFFNVLRGDMSLVGPRPPIAYEVEAYDIWHRARLLETKPGITGLWQVRGRSRVKFDEMVRLDLQYARTWSPWLDIKILLQTPKAVVLGEGAL